MVFVVEKTVCSSDLSKHFCSEKQQQQGFNNDRLATEVLKNAIPTIVKELKGGIGRFSYEDLSG